MTEKKPHFRQISPAFQAFRDAIRGWPFDKSDNEIKRKRKEGTDAAKKITDRTERQEASDILAAIDRFLETRLKKNVRAVKKR